MARETVLPAWRCALLVLGMLLPAALYTYRVKPEQSNPVLGLVPPRLYLTPTYFLAMLIGFLAAVLFLAIAAAFASGVWLAVSEDAKLVICSGGVISAGDDSEIAEVWELGVTAGDSRSEAKASAGEATRRRLPPMAAADMDMILLRVLVNMKSLRRLGPH